MASCGTPRDDCIGAARGLVIEYGMVSDEWRWIGGAVSGVWEDEPAEARNSA